jgi:hypothetical protein
VPQEYLRVKDVFLHIKLSVFFTMHPKWKNWWRAKIRLINVSNENADDDDFVLVRVDGCSRLKI